MVKFWWWLQARKSLKEAKEKGKGWTDNILRKYLTEEQIKEYYERKETRKKK